MKSLSFGAVLRSKSIFSILLTQIIILFFIYFHARTPFLWIWSTLSFIPVLIACLSVPKRWHTLSSLILFLFSQHAIFVFANPSWGFCFGSDAINDFHTASFIYENTHFELGQASYTSRPAYSYYPMLHLFSSTFSKVSGISLMAIARFAMPFFNVVLTTFSLFFLTQELFGMREHTRNLAVLFFGMSFYYTFFDSQFTRESFAFPLVLLSLWIFTRMIKNRQRGYTIIAPILIGAVIFSHQMSSYIFFAILILMTVGFSLFQHNNRLNLLLLLTAIMLGAYTLFVTLSFSIKQWTYALEAIQAVLHREGTYSLMRPYPIIRVALSISHYAILGLLTIIGGFRLIRQRSKDQVVLMLIAFFISAFIVSTLLRLSTSADVWSWTYYMSLRGTIWSFIGISVVVAIGVADILKLSNINKKKFFVLLIIICITALGKFSQYPTLITESTNTPVTYPRYIAALWLKQETVHGAYMLVAPYELDIDLFEASRDMAPYAYLKEYFLDETEGRLYHKFHGYIPLIGGFFDQYSDTLDVQLIYSNGDARIGYKK